MPHHTTVAVYGLGNMGYLIAQRLAARFSIAVSDLHAAQVARAVTQLGAVPCNPSGPLAASGPVEAVVLSLPSPAASMAVLHELAPRLARGSVVIETSTVNPADVHAQRALLAAHGVDHVDAPVLAGVGQMKAGTATLALGGEPAVIARVQEVLDAIAARQIHFGAAGAGAAAKVINNAVAHAVMVVVAEAGSLATATGVDCGKLIDILSDAQMGIQRPLTHRYAERIRAGDYEGGMPLDAARKDSILALQLAQDCGVPLFAIQASHSVYDLAAAAGYGRQDYAAIARLWADWGRPTVPAAPHGAAADGSAGSAAAASSAGSATSLAAAASPAGAPA
jgi:3-hydroxyisobutyrate dehydrogenase